MNRFLSLLLLLSMVACKDTTVDEPIDFKFDYVPLEVGYQAEYEVDSIVYDEFTATVDTFSFLMRETCVEVYQDLEGRDVYRFERSVKLNDTSQFVVQSTYGLILDELRLERLEENVRTVRLIFPPEDGKEWDANAFNAFDEQEFEFEDVDVEHSIGALMFQEALKVVQLNDTDNFVIKRYAEERYARGSGLISKRYFHIETQFEVDSGLLWDQRLIQVIRP